MIGLLTLNLVTALFVVREEQSDGDDPSGKTLDSRSCEPRFKSDLELLLFAPLRI